MDGLRDQFKNGSKDLALPAKLASARLSVTAERASGARLWLKQLPSRLCSAQCWGQPLGAQHVPSLLITIRNKQEISCGRGRTCQNEPSPGGTDTGAAALDSLGRAPHLPALVCMGKDPTFQPTLPRHRPLQLHRSLLSGSEREREMLEPVTERHVKILPEPSLQLSSGDVRSASTHGTAGQELHRGTSRHTNRPQHQLPACEEKEQNSKQQSTHREPGTPARGQGCSHGVHSSSRLRSDAAGTQRLCPTLQTSWAEHAGSCCSGTRHRLRCILPCTQAVSMQQHRHPRSALCASELINLLIH